MKLRELVKQIWRIIEGPAHTVWLGQDPILLSRIKEAVELYSRLPFESTTWWDGTSGRFLRFKTELWPKDEDEIPLFSTVIIRSIQEYFWRLGENPSIIIIPDPGERGQVWIQGYYGHTWIQNQELAEWYTRLTTAERSRAIEQITGLRDKALEQELATIKEIDSRIQRKGAEKYET